MNRRIIILIGKTGNGKSTLANVIAGQESNLFTESAGSTSETRDLNIKLVEIDYEDSEKVEYRIIDTVGVGDTQLTPPKAFFIN